MMTDERNYNCRGCGALLTNVVCPYCARPVAPGDVILPRGWSSNYPRPDRDPKRTIHCGKVLL